MSRNFPWSNMARRLCLQRKRLISKFDSFLLTQTKLEMFVNTVLIPWKIENLRSLQDLFLFCVNRKFSYSFFQLKDEFDRIYTLLMINKLQLPRTDFSHDFYLCIRTQPEYNTCHNIFCW